MSRRATALFVAVAVVLVLLGSSAALAKSTPVTSPALQVGGNGGWTVPLGFVDLARISSNVAAKGAATSPVTFAVSAAPRPVAKPAWGNLWAFPIALGAILFAVAVFFVDWSLSKPAAPRVKADEMPVKLSQPLKYLDATWSFDDSWVSNVTVLGGLLTGILGSTDVVTAFLGTDAKSSVALATVGAAVAAAFIGAGPIVLLASKTRDGLFFTAGGLLASSAVTLAGASGELWVVYRSGAKLDLGGWQHHIWIAALAAAVLLAVYAFRTLRATLNQGYGPPKEPPESDTIHAAKMIVAALQALPNVDVEQLERLVRATDHRHERGARDEEGSYPQRRRSALM